MIGIDKLQFDYAKIRYIPDIGLKKCFLLKFY